MQKHISDDDNQGKDVIRSMEEDIVTPYPEFVPSFHSWMLPQQQVEIANELVNMTKRKKGKKYTSKKI